MDKSEKRRACMKMLKATFIRIALIGDTISKKALIGEIMDKFEVSSRTANDYLIELTQMGFTEENRDMIWYRNEKKVREEYLKDE